MKTLITVSVRLFVLFAVIRFVASMGFTVISYSNALNEPHASSFPLARIQFVELIVWAVYLSVLILVWIKAHALTELMFRDTQPMDESLEIAPQVLLEVGVTILATYLVIETVPQLINWVGNLISVKSRFIAHSLPSEWKIREVAGILAVALKLCLAVFLIIDRRIISQALRLRS